VPVTRVRITHTTTDKVPNASPTAASSGSDLNGLAVLNACRILKTRLAHHFQQAQGCNEVVCFDNGQVTCGGSNTTFTELAHSAWMARVSLSSTGFYRTPGLHFDKESGQGRPFYYFACGAAVTEVEVDGRTGAYTFPRTDILHDVGTSLNPAIDRGQVEGGYLQGLGWLTSEDLVWAKDGRLLSNSPANYKIPTADMCPAELNVSFYNQPNIEETVYRSKAVGEPPLMLAVSAWCALRQACKGFGNKLPNLGAPATPEAVYWAIQEAKSDA